jgi:hypothetical protein
MNWDTAIERHLMNSSFCYGYDAISARFADADDEVAIMAASAPIQQVFVLKPHGSVNWLYCDACRKVFWFPPSQTEKIAQQLFRDFY